MLKGIDPLLTGELLQALDRMGHGDRIVIADGNFPAASLGPAVIRITTADIVAVIAAILRVLPLDGSVDRPLARMCPDSGPDSPNPAQQRVLVATQQAHGAPLEFDTIPRHDFYQVARTAFAIVQTLEAAPYCDFVLTKGTV